MTFSIILNETKQRVYFPLQKVFLKSVHIRRSAEVIKKYQIEHDLLLWSQLKKLKIDTNVLYLVT